MMKTGRLVVLVALSVVTLFSLYAKASAETKDWSAVLEQYSIVDPESSGDDAKKADTERNFYVTVSGGLWGSSSDKVYFGPRRLLSNGSYSGALCDGLSYYPGKNTQQKMAYYKDASIPVGEKYGLRVKQGTDGPGSYVYTYGKWTP